MWTVITVWLAVPREGCCSQIGHGARARAFPNG